MPRNLLSKVKVGTILSLTWSCSVNRNAKFEVITLPSEDNIFTKVKALDNKCYFIPMNGVDEILITNDTSLKIHN